MKTVDLMPMLELRQLYYFLALADHGSISAAAEALGMAQPSLSENVAKLERRLNVKLVLRGARGVELTEAGRAFTARGRQLLQMSQSLVEAVQAVGGAAVGHVAVGLPPSIGLVLAVPLAETVQSELPEVRLHVSEGMSRSILERIENEIVHLGCVYDVPDASTFIAHPLLTEEMFLVTAPDNWPEPIGPDGRALRPITVAEVEGLPLVLPNSSHGARTLIERQVRGHNVKLNVAMEIDALPHIIEMVCRASAYSILSEAAVREHVNAGRLAMVPIEGVKIERTAFLVRKRSRPISRAVLEVQNSIIMIIDEMISRYRLSARMHAIQDKG
jgi:LysR family transcriptional regulator, nitrogen assimilation regulatory protein